MRNRRTKSLDRCRYATHLERDDETAAEGRRLEKALEVGLGRAAARSLGRHENSDSCNHKSLSARRGWSRKRV